MSKELLPVDEAMSNLIDHVELQAFATKMASLGRPIHTMDQAVRYLEIASKLNAIEQANGIKQAQASVNPLDAASNYLDQVMAQYGLKTAGDMDEDASIYAAADHLMSNGTIYDSVLSVKYAEAMQYAQQGG